MFLFARVVRDFICSYHGVIMTEQEQLDMPYSCNTTVPIHKLADRLDALCHRDTSLRLHIREKRDAGNHLCHKYVIVGRPDCAGGNMTDHKSTTTSYNAKLQYDASNAICGGNVTPISILAKLFAMLPSVQLTLVKQFEPVTETRHSGQRTTQAAISAICCTQRL